jgi:hypothetical protein
MYGRLINMLRGRGVVTVTDREYLAGDLEVLMKRAATESRPDRAINRQLVYGRALEGAEAFLPSMTIAEARLPSDDPNAAERTWERTDILQEDLATHPQMARGIANGIIDLLTGIPMHFPDVLLRGDTRWYWGDPVEFKMQSVSSDLSIGLVGQRFRSERILHSVDVETPDSPAPYTSGLYLSPATAIG